MWVLDAWSWVGLLCQPRWLSEAFTSHCAEDRRCLRAPGGPAPMAHPGAPKAAPQGDDPLVQRRPGSPGCDQGGIGPDQGEPGRERRVQHERPPEHAELRHVPAVRLELIVVAAAD